MQKGPPMHSKDVEAVTPVDATIVRIMDRGEIKEIDYHGAITPHIGSLWSRDAGRGRSLVHGRALES